MNDEILYEEIINDPLNMGYKDPDTQSWRPHEQIAKMMNDKTVDVPAPIPLEDLVEYLIREDIWMKIRYLASHPENNVLSHAAQLLWSIIHQPHMRMIDYSLPFWTDLVETGLKEEDIRKLGTAKTSRARQLNLGRVEYWDVGRVQIHGGS